MGGPLNEGDIEEIGGAGELCIICPWHRWKFSLETGLCASESHRLKQYPVKIRGDCQQVFIGFESLHSNVFSTDDF